MKEMTFREFLNMICNLGTGVPSEINQWFNSAPLQEIIEWIDGVASNIFNEHIIDVHNKLVRYKPF